MLHRGLLLAAIYFVTSLAVGTGRADERSTAREHYFKGTKAF